MSVMSVSMVNVPLRSSRARAAALEIGAPRMAAAMPMPINQWPSRTLAGVGLRCDQPKRCAPLRRHAMKGRVENGRCGCSGSTWVSLTMRSCTGSMPTRSASSSMATSSAIIPGASPGARMALPSARSSTASRTAVMRLAPA